MNLTELMNEPIFIAGIGPPLEQIEQDYRDPQTTVGEQTRSDILALIAEIHRLRRMRP